MASSGAPRHSKQDRTNVTIELTPEDAASSAGDQGSKDGEAEVLSAPSDATETGPAAPFEQQMSPPHPVPPPAHGFSGLGAGLAGGALALLGGAALQWGGALPTFRGGAETTALRQEIAVLSEKFGAPAVDPAMIEELKSEQDAALKSLETLGAGLAQAQAAHKSLADEFAALKLSSPAPDGGQAALTERVASLETRLEALNTADASSEMSALQAQIVALEKRSGESSGASVVAQAIAAAGLKAAIDRGGSFANELETFATVAPASLELEQLKNLAASGVPSKAELSVEFGDAADAILAAARPSDPNAGLIARLTASARGLVRSRPVGTVEGDTPEALLARMETAVTKGDLDAALAEAAKLPDAPRAAGIDYINRLTARRDADALVTKALTTALAAAGDPK